MKNFWLPISVVVIIAVMVGIFAVGNKSSKTPTPTNTTSLGEANNEPAGLKSRLEAIGLPALAAEGSTLHIHQHLDIYLNGKVATVPAHIGMPSNNSFISALHTHDDSGIIHIESPTAQDFTLGQLFQIWNVKLEAASLGDHKADDQNKLRLYVNGQLVEGNPADLKLAAHQEIVIAYGTDAQLPSPIPSKFDFPGGL